MPPPPPPHRFYQKNHVQLQQPRRRPRVVFNRLTSRDGAGTGTGASGRATTAQANMAAETESGADPVFAVPTLFTVKPILRDALSTDTSLLQDKTVDEILPYLSGRGDDGDDPDAAAAAAEVGERNVHGVPRLDRSRHATFLRRQLGHLPQMFTAADPSRPWFFYWCLSGLSLLGEDPASYRERLVATVRPMQNSDTTGGFAGGFGQTSHLATTYATVLSLALVGGVEAYQVVDRRSMWKWLCQLKQPGGGFQMAIGGEEDVRGAYCAAVIISILRLPLNLSPDSPAYAAGHTTLFSGLAEWIQRCQTYEGGVSAKPGAEAHGAYAFCALGCLAIIDSPHRSVPRSIDIPRLISWLSARQYAPEGGFSGRTNKLVDGCYSHWVGGCWPLIETSLSGPREGLTTVAEPVTSTDHAAAASASLQEDGLFSRNGLIRYILSCCQDTTRRGGLRDKPSKFSDAYHTCYVLAGLSSAQHQWALKTARAEPAMLDGDEWIAAPYMKGEQIFDEEDRVSTTHPVYVIPQHKLQDMWAYFESKPGF